MAITTTSFAKYTILPGIWPRVKELFSSGFSFLASVIAILYYNIGLLPAGHAYLDSKNYGRFGIRHVVAEAGKGLVFSRKHIDQIVLYFTILTGLVILALQFILLLTSLIAEPVFAASWFDTFPVSWSNYFLNTPFGPSQDIAFVVLDKVFGAMQLSGTGSTLGFFGSCVSDTGTPCEDIMGNVVFSPTVFPTPFHLALHQMLAFYSLGIAFISGAIIIYFIVTIIGETATSGTPFGRRLNKAWFIPRLIVFFALVAPITLGGGNNDGLNVAQLITLSVAKFGSNMATNAWDGFAFDQAAVSGIPEHSTLLGQGQLLLALPNVPELGNLTQFMHLVRMCMYAEKVINGIDVFPYVVRPPSTDTTTVNLYNGGTAPYNTMGWGAADSLSYFGGGGFPIFFDEAWEFSRYQNVVLRFGHRNPPGPAAPAVVDPNDPPGEYDEWGYVEPTCGEIVFEVISSDPFVVGPVPAALSAVDASIQDNYWLFINQYLTWDEIFNEVPYCMIRALLPYDPQQGCVNTPLPNAPDPPGTDPAFQLPGGGPAPTLNINFPLATNTTHWLTVDNARASLEIANAINKATMTGQYLDWTTSSPAGTVPFSIDDILLNSYDDPLYVNNLIMSPQIRERGWAGAALWYNKLAEINGSYGAAMQNIPRPFKYPKVMEEVARQHLAEDKNTPFTGRFNPRLGNGKLADLPRPGDQYIAAALYSAHEFWNSAAVQETTFTRRSNNAIIDGINMILGTQGIFDIVENAGVHPLAMLSGLGKSMVDAALRNLFIGVVGQGAGTTMDNFIGKLGGIAGSFLFRMGMVGMGIGFVLYYVLPIMPFIYFFFAFCGWIKSIFEAVLAMPLWALAHIKIDGEGLPGPWATNGYFLLFEIFLRPLLIIFGFVFSITVYAALVDTLHNSYHLLTFIAGGYDIEAEINQGGLSPERDVSVFTTFTANNTFNFMRGPIDELFYTVLYVIIVYMIGLSTFKLVDSIPNNIMRWMGVTVSTFHETAGDPASQLASKMYRGVNMTNAQIMGIMEKGSDAAIDQTLATGVK